MSADVEEPNPDKPIGKYKINNNQIKNGAGTVVFTPPTVSETKEYTEIYSSINIKRNNIYPWYVSTNKYYITWKLHIKNKKRVIFYWIFMILYVIILHYMLLCTMYLF